MAAWTLGEREFGSERLGLVVAKSMFDNASGQASPAKETQQSR
jgi:hypothetical protein